MIAERSKTGSDPNTVRAMLMLPGRRGRIARKPNASNGRALRGGHTWDSWRNRLYVFAPLLFPATN